MKSSRLPSFYARMLGRERQIRLTNLPIDIGPANIEELTELVALDRQYFPLADIVSVEVFKSWQQKNDSIFTAIRTNEGVAGYYAILPLKTKALKRLVLGHLREREIKPRDILDKGEASQCRKLYLFSVAVKVRYSRLTLLLFSHLACHLKKLRDEGNLKKIYAVAATPEGANLLRKLHFQRIREGTDRADGHPIYAKYLTEIKRA